MIDLEKLLAETESDPPSGPNLEYDDAVRELAQAVEGVPDQEMGEQKIAGVPPNWKKARELGEALFARTKDLRVAVSYLRAVVHTEGLTGLNDGLKLIHGMLDQYWNTVHPALEDDGKDSSMRINALAALADPDGLLSDFRQTTLAEEPRAGRVTVRDVLIATNKLPASSGEEVRPIGFIEGVVRHTAKAGAPRIEAARALAGSVKAVQMLIADKVNPLAAVELAPLLEMVEPVSAVCARVLEASDMDNGTVVPTGGGSPARTVLHSVHSGTGAPGEIRSRDDAAAALDRVCEFLERTEPANPAPLLIRRARRLLTMKFVEIIEELAPNSLQDIKGLGGVKDE